MTNSLLNTCAGIFRSFVGNAEPAPSNMATDDAADEKKPGLFAQCTFALIRTATWPQQGAEIVSARTRLEPQSKSLAADLAQLASEIRLHDGEVVVDDYPEKDLDLSAITQVISDTSDFPDYKACSDALIPVTKPLWVAHCLARDKLLNPRQYSPDPRYFMSDVCVCIADLPAGDADAIAGGILAMGGLWSSKLTSQVTHIITLSMDSETVATAEKRRLPVKVVLPHWVDDCLKLGRKIDEQPYQLPDPEILNGAPSKPPMGKRKTQVEGAIHPDPVLSGQEPTVPRTLTKVFKKKSIMLADDLGISPYLRSILNDLITTGGGKLADSVSKADMFVCKYREGQNYKIAARAGKDVGNLAWLYFLIQTDEWTSPTRRMLHYPVAKEGLPGFPGMMISLSNYSGDARSYLENLIFAAGATCTKTLKQDNTHLITAHDTSEKCAAAREWGVHVVNHLWLEESYARWRLQSVTNTRYTHFPQRTNLGDVCGSTQLDHAILEQRFFPDEDTDMTDAPAIKPMRQVNQNAVQSASIRRIKSEQTTKAGSSPQTPSRQIALGKENVTPSTANSRKSKEVAASRLHVAAEDIALFEKESKRKGGVVYGGRRKSDPERVELGRKRSMEEMSDDEESDDSDAKKQKRNTEPPQIRLVISKFDKWVNKPKDEDRDKVTDTLTHLLTSLLTRRRNSFEAWVF